MKACQPGQVDLEAPPHLFESPTSTSFCWIELSPVGRGAFCDLKICETIEFARKWSKSLSDSPQNTTIALIPQRNSPNAGLVAGATQRNFPCWFTGLDEPSAAFGLFKVLPLTCSLFSSLSGSENHNTLPWCLKSLQFSVFCSFQSFAVFSLLQFSVFAGKFRLLND